MTLNFTDEQEKSIELSTTGEDLKMNAFAGAGKTSTLIGIGEALSSYRGLSLTFNKANAEEAASRFPRNVQCKTGHSLAYSAIVRPQPAYQYKLKGRLNGGLVSRILKISHPKEIYPFSFSQFGNHVLSTVTRYMNSESDIFEKKHVPLKAIREFERKTKVTVPKETLFKIYADAHVLWNKMIDPLDDTYMTHDTYLKLYALSKPDLKSFDFVMLDEAQDSNGVMLSIIGNSTSQQIYVGDQYQQIYAWRGAVNAMGSIQTEHTCELTQSFRFGKNIAALATKILQTELACRSTVKGLDTIEDSIEYIKEPDCILFRTNAGLIVEAIDQISQNKKVAIVGDVTAMIRLVEGIKELDETGRSSHFDLSDFVSYHDFLEYIDSEHGKDLAVIVNVISDIGYQGLITNLNMIKTISEDEADVILSTAHKSKGREWDKVKLANDFKQIESLAQARDENKDFAINPEEFNLLYVAITRAKRMLDVSALYYFTQLNKGSKENGLLPMSSQ